MISKPTQILNILKLMIESGKINNFPYKIEEIKEAIENIEETRYQLKEVQHNIAEAQKSLRYIKNWT